jgi:hypothetical protein
MAGFVSEPLFAGVRLTGPGNVGVMVNVCAAAELLKVFTMGTPNPPPDGPIVMVPVYGPLGVTVKFVDALLIGPLAGPVSVKLAADAVTELDEADGKPFPNILSAIAMQVYAAPGVKLVTVIGLDAPGAPILPGLQVAT